MEYKDYYATLGIDKKASAETIKKAYRRLARKYHPDVSKEKDAEEKFKNVQEAYEVLKDPEKRKAYDQLGSNWKSGQEFRPPPGWNQQSHFQTAGDFEDLSGFSDFFANLFGGREARSARSHGGSGFQANQAKGQDQHAKITISLEEAFHGTTQNLQLQVPEIDETGRVFYKMRTLKVNIPAGALAGQQLRLAGQGNPSQGRGVPGDIYLEIQITPSSKFSLQGRDVYLTLPVTPWEVALGAEIRVPTLGGVVGMKIIPGSQGGQKLRLKGRGMPHKTHPGDQYVILQVLVPKANTEEERALFKKMSEIMPFNPRGQG